MKEYQEDLVYTSQTDIANATMAIIKFFYGIEDEYLFATAPEQDYSELLQIAQSLWGKTLTEQICISLISSAERMVELIRVQSELVMGCAHLLPDNCIKCKETHTWVLDVYHLKVSYKCAHCGYRIKHDVWPDALKIQNKIDECK